MALKFFQNYFSYQFSLLVGGRKNYQKEKQAHYSLQKAVIKNKKLAQDVERAYKKKGAPLSYSEYLAIDQFGRYGYHNTHKEYGETSTHTYWPQAVWHLCKLQGFTHILEIGPGESKLGIAVLQLAQKDKAKLLWGGIEISKALQEKIKKRFANNGFEKQIFYLSDTLKTLKLSKKVLVIFSYALDSIPPDIFVNTKPAKSFPNVSIGVTVKNGVLTEQYTKSNILEKSLPFSLSLFPGQRAYLPIAAFSLLSQVIQKIPTGSQILIIDEFRRPALPHQTEHLLLPKDLGLFDRDLRNINKAYQESGENLLYYPCFLDWYTSILEKSGISHITYAEEHFAAKHLQTHTDLPISVSHLSHCYAILGTRYKTAPGLA